MRRQVPPNKKKHIHRAAVDPIVEIIIYIF